MTETNDRLTALRPLKWEDHSPTPQKLRFEARHPFGTYLITTDPAIPGFWTVSPLPLGSSNGGRYMSKERAIRAAETDYATRMGGFTRPAPQGPDLIDRPAAREALSEALSGALDCTRVWDAWRVGTMTQDDFIEIASDDARLDEIIDAVAGPLVSEITALRAEIAALTAAHDTVCGALAGAVRAEALAEMVKADHDAGLFDNSPD